LTPRDIAADKAAMEALPLDVDVVVLTQDEERNIVRCVESVVGHVTGVFVVDSGSTDATRRLAREAGASVFEHPWPGYGPQRNWALEHLPLTATWTFFLDADEFVDEPFLAELSESFARATDEVAGFSIRRWLDFEGARVAHGGLQKTRILRILRRGRGRCDDRVVNEHLVVEGEERPLDVPVGHRNESGLWRWLVKHHGYAPLEARALLDDLLSPAPAKGPLALSRHRKRRLYAALPPVVRSFARFGYTMTVQKGWRDGVGGGAYHLLHDLLYPFVIDGWFVAEAVRRLARRVR
jgi:glycosyltransferase involved in cell wall biosynthesis